MLRDGRPGIVTRCWCPKRSLAQPHADQTRPKRATDRPIEVRHHGVDVDLVAKTSGEGRGGPLRIDAGAIESAVDTVLDPASERLEQVVTPLLRQEAVPSH